VSGLTTFLESSHSLIKTIFAPPSEVVKFVWKTGKGKVPEERDLIKRGAQKQRHLKVWNIGKTSRKNENKEKQEEKRKWRRNTLKKI
jgi:hypothetical protein